MTKNFVRDNRFASAPPMPPDRPPTRAEVWAHVEHYYLTLKTRAELVAMARTRWAGNYAYWVNFNGWRKQPDWTVDDPIIATGVPAGPMEPGKCGYRDVKALLEAANRERIAA